MTLEGKGVGTEASLQISISCGWPFEREHKDGMLIYQQNNTQEKEISKKLTMGLKNKTKQKQKCHTKLFHNVALASG